MKEDFTKFTHNKKKHSNGVLKQQGRVELDADANENETIHSRINQQEMEESIKKEGQKETKAGSKIPTILILALLLGAIAGALAGLAVQSLFAEGDEDTPITIKDDNVGIGTTSPDTKLDVDGVISAEGGNSDQWNTAYGWGDHSTEGYLMNYTETDPVYGVSAASGITSGDIIDWNTAYGWGDHSTEGFLTSETDPIYGVSAASEISSGDVSNWNTAYGWGDHSTEGYLTSLSETDPIYGVSVASGITSSNITNWDTAFGWGDHSTKGYLTSLSETDPVYGVSAASGITSGDITNWDTAFGWGDHAAIGYLTGESDPQVGTISLDYVPKWDGFALVTGSIFDNGNIGIGTASPGAKLDVEVSSGGAATIGSSSNSAIGDYTIAMGYNTTASGNYSIAMGRGANASGFASIAMGYSTDAYGIYSTAMGLETNASGWISTAMGYSTDAYGSYSTAMGYDTDAYGDYSTAMGFQTNASGYASTAMGRSIITEGNYSIGIGLDNNPSGWTITQDNVMAIMGGNVSIGTTSTGVELRLRVAGRIAPTWGTATDPSYRFGNGAEATGFSSPSADTIAFITSGTERMRITIGGNVGIGTTSPSSKLDVVGDIEANNMPGLEHTGLDFDYVDLPGGWTNIRSVELTVNSGGYILVTFSGSASIEAGGGAYVVVGIDTTTSAADTDITIKDQDAGDFIPFSVQYVYQVGSAGTYTYYGNALSSDGLGDIYNCRMTAIYVPNRY
jgi:hypothetical protein